MSFNKITLKLWYKDPCLFFRDVFDLEPYPYQCKVLRDLKDLNNNRILILSAGGTGKTRLLAGSALWSSTALSYYLQKPYDTIIISGSEDQSRYLYEYCTQGIENNSVLASMVQGEPLKSITKFSNGSVIRALPNSLKAIQGKHSDCVIVDEACLAGDFVIRDTFRIVSTSPYNRIILSGTPMEYDSIFVDYYEDAQKPKEQRKYPEWKVYSWSAFECPRISQQALEEAKKLPTDMFTIFWMGKPYPIVDTVVNIKDIRECSDRIDKFEYDPDADLTVMGIDWGWKAPTVVVIVQYIDDEIRVLEDIEWTRQRYEDVHSWIEALAKQYKVDRIYCDLNPKGESQRLQEKPLPVFPVALNSERPMLQSRMRQVFELKKIRIPEEFVKLLYQLKRYRWDTKEGDDHVVALMLALKEAEKPSKQHIVIKKGTIKRGKIVRIL